MFWQIIAETKYLLVDFNIILDLYYHSYTHTHTHTHTSRFQLPSVLAQNINCKIP